MKIAKTLHPTPYTPHPTPTKNFLPQILLMRTGTHARGTDAKGGINNQSLITGFSVIR